MKKLAAFILILFLLPTILAIEFDIKEEFSQGETLLAKVSGNFLQPLQKSNVFFYRGHVKIPLEYDIKKINDEYYIYALLAEKPEGNYSLTLEDIRYMKGVEISEENAIKNFSINNQTTDFSINPGFATDNEFFIEVQNFQDKEITIEIKTKEDQNDSGESYADPITLKSGKKQKISFDFRVQEPIFQFIELSTENLTYNIPSYIPIVEITGDEIFKFSEDLIVSAPTNEETKRTIYIYNTGSEPIEDVVLSLSNSLENYANLSKESINKIDPDSNIPIELTFFSEDEFELEGHVKASYDLETIYSQISVKFIENYTAPPAPSQDYMTKTCGEWNYGICNSTEKCSITEIEAKDNTCCPGQCNALEKPSPVGKIIGIVLFVVIVIFLLWFYKKYKGAKKPFNLLKIAKGKTKESKPPKSSKSV